MLMLFDPVMGKRVSTMHVCRMIVSIMPCPGTMNAAILTEGLRKNHNKVIVVNMSTRKVLGKIDLFSYDKYPVYDEFTSGGVDNVFWRKDGRYIYVVNDRRMFVINASTFTIVNHFNSNGDLVAADMSPDGSTLLMFRRVVEYNGNEDKYDFTVNRLDTATNRIVANKLVHLNVSADFAGPLRYSPDGTKAYAFIYDKSGSYVKPNLCIIDTNTLDVRVVEHALPRLHGTKRTQRMDLEISPDGQRLYMLYSSGLGTSDWERHSVIFVYNLETGTCEHVQKTSLTPGSPLSSTYTM